MGFLKSLGKGLAIGAGAGLGLSLAGQLLGGFDRVFQGGGHQHRQFCGCDRQQFQQMNAFMAGRAYQAQIDRQMLTMAYARLLCA